jgi:hypothetical protein
VAEGHKVSNGLLFLWRDKMNHAKFVKEHTALVSKICDVLKEADMSAEDGELALLWLAGLSLGMRQADMTDSVNSPLAMLALGWQVGACDTEDDL